MKRYIKNDEIRFANEIVVAKEGIKYYNPPETMILADGWAVYMEEPTLDEVKEQKIRELEAYNNSPEINIFYINDEPCPWMDCNERAIAINTCNACKKKGMNEITYYIGDSFKTLPIDFVLDTLADLDIYAMMSMNVTAQHRNRIKALGTIDEVRSYDFTTDYPQILNFKTK